MHAGKHRGRTQRANLAHPFNARRFGCAYTRQCAHGSKLTPQAWALKLNPNARETTSPKPSTRTHIAHHLSYTRPVIASRSMTIKAASIASGPLGSAAMDSCPACGGSLRDHGQLHCTSGSCPWILCGTCASVVDADTASYWNGKALTWGTPDGYLKAD